jgi:hypothetical protein
VKFSYPLFNQRLETVSTVTSVENNLYLTAVQALRLFIDQVYTDFMDEMRTMNATDYEIYITTDFKNVIEKAFSEGQVHVRVARNELDTECSTPLLTRDFPDDRICVKATNYGPQPLHDADEKLRYRRDQDIRNSRMTHFMENSPQ